VAESPALNGNIGLFIGLFTDAPTPPTLCLFLSEFLSQALFILSVRWRPAQSQEPRHRQKVSVCRWCRCVGDSGNQAVLHPMRSSLADQTWLFTKFTVVGLEKSRFFIEVDELAQFRREVTTGQIAERVKEFYEKFEIGPDFVRDELERAARTSVALDRLVMEHDLGSLAYYYLGTGNTDNVDAISSIILGNSLLTARGIPVAGEYEIKNAQAMKIMDSFGAGGSFTEYYAMDFKDDVVLMGHDGPGHIAIAQGKTRCVRSTSIRARWDAACRSRCP